MIDYHELIANRVIQRAEKLGRQIDYIEVGVLTGNSALAVMNTGKVRYGLLVDDFSNTHCGEWKSSPEIAASALAPYAGMFDLKVGNSRDILPLVTAKFDVGFVDGEHTYTACWCDMDNMLRLLRHDGVMFVDDMENPSELRDAAERFAYEKQLIFIYHQVHNGLAELRQK
jgi:predicted O-methyltransferase YrrM